MSTESVGREEAVALARELGTKAAARELGIDAKTLKAWRREANRAARHVEVAVELDVLEQELAAADDLASLYEVKRRASVLVRELRIRPERVPFLIGAED